MTNSLKISAVLIVLNEEKNLKDCLAGLSFCDEIILVDSGSQDRTVELAKTLGANVFLNPFLDFASQKNFGIAKAQHEWVLLVDADERVSQALAAEIKEVLKDPDAEGYYLRRENRIFGRWMRHGINAKDLQLRFARKEKAKFEGRVHERIFLQTKTRCFKNPLLHYSTTTVEKYMKKLNIYTSLEAEALAAGDAAGEASAARSEGLHEHGGVSQAAGSAILKRRPLLLFFYRHFFQLGLLDGMEGFLFNGLSAYYEFVRHAKRWELETKGKMAT